MDWFPLKIVLVLPIKGTCLVGSIECNTIVVPIQFESGSSSRDDNEWLRLPRVLNETDIGRCPVPSLT